MLTDAQRVSFDTGGYCILPAAFGRAVADEMASNVWAALREDLGLSLDEPTTWDRAVDAKAPLERLKQGGTFRSVATNRLADAVADLLGTAWSDGRGWGGVLITMPAQDQIAWDVPFRGWHCDVPPCRPDPVQLRMFAYLSDVRPQGGGTLVVAGSHRVAAAWAERNPDLAGSSSEFRRSLRGTEPWFADLFGTRPLGSGADRFMDETMEVLGVSVRVVEFTADAGDVVLWHPSLLHTAAPNALNCPRLMLTHTIQRVAPTST